MSDHEEALAATFTALVVTAVALSVVGLGAWGLYAGYSKFGWGFPLAVGAVVIYGVWLYRWFMGHPDAR